VAKTTRTKKGQKKSAAAKKGSKKAASGGKGQQQKSAPAKGQTKKDKGSLKSRAQKAQAAKQSKSSSRERGGVGKFLREVRIELSKVTWPNRDELTQSTIVVFIAIAIAALYIAFFDQIFTRLIELIS
jgi:preprotein translocase subunit SecE